MEDEDGLFAMPVEEDNDDDAQDPPQPLNLISVFSDDETRPALSSSRPMEQDDDDDEESDANQLIRQLVRLAQDNIPFVCVSSPDRVVASVRNGHGTATFCHVTKYMIENNQEGLTMRDVPWAARMLAYVNARDHHCIPVARASHADTFQDYSRRLAEMKVAADLLVRNHPNSCVAIQEDWEHQAGLARIFLKSSFTRRHVWAVLGHVFEVLKSQVPFYDEQHVIARLDDNLLACWNQMLQELRAQRVQAQNNI